MGLLLIAGVTAVAVLKARKLDAPDALQQVVKPAKPKSRQNEPPESADPNAPEAPAYVFYDRLPKFEVVVPEKVARAELKSPLETRKGTYVLQAGTYQREDDAERVRGKLGALGVQSTLQPVTVNNNTMSRVRIGPITNLDDLNRTREVLRKARIDAKLIRLGD